MPSNTLQLLDTLQYDTVLVRQLQQAPDYDYHREFIEQDYSLIDRIVRWLEEIFSTTFRHATGDETSLYWLIGGIVVVIAAGIYLFTHDVGIFRRDGKADLDYEVEDEDITARCFCHEIEHLDGHLFSEHCDRLLTDEELEQYLKEHEDEYEREDDE